MHIDELLHLIAFLLIQIKIVRRQNILDKDGSWLRDSFGF